MEGFIQTLTQLVNGLSKFATAIHLSSQPTPNQNNKSSHQRCSIRKGILRYFTKFTGKHLCQSLFFNKVALH